MLSTLKLLLLLAHAPPPPTALLLMLPLLLLATETPWGVESSPFWESEDGAGEEDAEEELLAPRRRCLRAE